MISGNQSLNNDKDENNDKKCSNEDDNNNQSLSWGKEVYES